MGGNYCAFNYHTMPSRDVCVIWLPPATAGVPPLTDERPNLLISQTGVEVGWEGKVKRGVGGGLYDKPNASTRHPLTVANKIKEPLRARVRRKMREEIRDR